MVVTVVQEQVVVVVVEVVEVLELLLGEEEPEVLFG